MSQTYPHRPTRPAQLCAAANVQQNKRDGPSNKYVYNTGGRRFYDNRSVLRESMVTGTTVASKQLLDGRSQRHPEPLPFTRNHRMNMESACRRLPLAAMTLHKNERLKAWRSHSVFGEWTTRTNVGAGSGTYGQTPCSTSFRAKLLSKLHAVVTV